MDRGERGEYLYNDCSEAGLKAAALKNVRFSETGMTATARTDVHSDVAVVSPERNTPMRTTVSFFRD